MEVKLSARKYYGPMIDLAHSSVFRPKESQGAIISVVRRYELRNRSLSLSLSLSFQTIKGDVSCHVFGLAAVSSLAVA